MNEIEHELAHALTILRLAAEVNRGKACSLNVEEYAAVMRRLNRAKDLLTKAFTFEGV